jgi:flagellar biosynthesis protein
MKKYTRRKAVALRYQPPDDKAPVVSAKGQGYLAEKIVQLARENYIPIREDRVLVQTLALLNLDQQIPPQAYRAVAEILAFLYRLDRQASTQR